MTTSDPMYTQSGFVWRTAELRCRPVSSGVMGLKPLYPKAARGEALDEKQAKGQLAAAAKGRRR